MDFYWIKLEDRLSPLLGIQITQPHKLFLLKSSEHLQMLTSGSEHPLLFCNSHWPPLPVQHNLTANLDDMKQAFKAQYYIDKLFGFCFSQTLAEHASFKEQILQKHFRTTRINYCLDSRHIETEYAEKMHFRIHYVAVHLWVPSKSSAATRNIGLNWKTEKS